MGNIIFFIFIMILIVCIIIVMNKKVIQRFTENNCDLTDCTFLKYAPEQSLGSVAFPFNNVSKIYEGSYCFGSEIKINREFDTFIETHPNIDRVLINLINDNKTPIESRRYKYKITLIPKTGKDLDNKELLLVRDNVISFFSKSDENYLDGSSPSITFNDCSKEIGSHGSAAPVGSHGSVVPGGNHGSGAPVGSHGSAAPVRSHGSVVPGGNHGSVVPVGSHGSSSDKLCDILRPKECFTGNIKLNNKQVVNICSKLYCGDACMTHKILYNTPMVSCDTDKTKKCFQFKEKQITPEELRKCDSMSFKTKNICASLQCKTDKCYENTDYITLSPNPSKIISPSSSNEICDNLYCEDTNSPSYVDNNDTYSRRKKELCETLKCKPYVPNEQYQNTNWEKCSPVMNHLWDKMDETRKTAKYKEQTNYNNPAGCESIPNYQSPNGCEQFTGSIQENFQNVPCASRDLKLGTDENGSDVFCSNFDTACEDGKPLDNYTQIYDKYTLISDKDPEKKCPKCGNCDTGEEDNTPEITPDTINILTDGIFEDITEQDNTIITTFINNNYSTISTGVIFENQNDKLLIKINLKNDITYQQAYVQMSNITNRQFILTTRLPLTIISVNTTLEPHSLSPSPAERDGKLQHVLSPAPAPAPVEMNKTLQHILSPAPAEMDKTYKLVYAPAPASATDKEHVNTITIKFNKSCEGLTQNDIAKIKSNIGNLLNIHVNNIKVSCGSIKVAIVLPNEITESELSRITNILINKKFNIRLDNGVVLEKVNMLSNNITLFKEELTYSGPVSSSKCEENSDTQEFNQFMKMFGGLPDDNNKRGGKNIMQYEPKGAANIFAPYLKVN